MATAFAPPQSLADLHERLATLGDIPPQRIRLQPWPGEATEDDLLAHGQHKCLCELIDGVLVEKAMGYRHSQIAGYLLTLLNGFVLARNLGIVLGEQGPVRLFAGRVRMPDLTFVSWLRFPGRRPIEELILDVAPNLVVEVLSPSNTLGEMRGKRDDYFGAGVELVWEIDLEQRTVAAYTRPDAADAVLTVADTLDGGTVLPGFTLPLAQLFAELDRHG